MIYYIFHLTMVILNVVKKMYSKLKKMNITFLVINEGLNLEFCQIDNAISISPNAIISQHKKIFNHAIQEII